MAAMTTTPESILQFWFGDFDSFVDGYPPDFESRQRLWFMGGTKNDDAIRARFAPTLAAACAGECDDWAQTPAGALALVVLLDQFPRNIHRAAAAAFACDARARAVSDEIVARDMDSQLPLSSRPFCYLPQMHAEDARRQEQCVALFQKLLAATAPARRQEAQKSVDFALAHRDIVARFGRFPHRNPILGRASTAAETAYLQSGGARFGQGDKN